MLYLIGGASRSGKSLLAQRLVKEKEVPYFPLDALIVMFASAAPELGVSHDLAFIEKSKKAWSFTEDLFKHFLDEEESYTIEGDCILPYQIHEFKNKYNKEIRCCFIGYTKLLPETKLKFVRDHNRGETDWTNKQTDNDMIGMIEQMIEYSKFLKEECAKYNIEFFDVSDDFTATQEKAFEYLTK
jgi:hypothetical protein